MMRKLGDLLFDAVGSTEVLRMAAAQATYRDWAGIVGEGLAARSEPLKYEMGTLHIAVVGSAWAQEIMLRRDVLLERLNARAGRPLFRTIRISVVTHLAAPEGDGSR